MKRESRFARGLARVLLTFYPADFRERHAELYIDTTAHIWERERARAGAPGAVLRMLWIMLSDTIRAAPRAHRGGRAPRGGPQFSLLDFKLGARMLARYPVLTVVGGLAIAFGICVGAGTFELTKQWISPDLNLPSADRIVGIELWDQAEQRAEERMLYDFARWRSELRTIEHVSAFRESTRNLITDSVGGEPVTVAAVTASSFLVTRVPARLGRYLSEEDAQPEAPAVVVIGHELWQERFGGANVIGRDVKLDNVTSTIVGVMPEEYAFPIYHQAWVPLRTNALLMEPDQGPAIHVFGRLADNADMDDAQAELNFIGGRIAAEHAERRGQLRPRVLPYARSIITLTPGDFAGLKSVNVAVLLLIALACGNVALLIFARAATRESEIVVRSALGASRGRIISQLFVEALLLGSVGALLGLAAARYGIGFAATMIDLNMGPLPFWVNAEMSTPTLLYAALLTVFSAFLAGVVPALRVTRGIGARLRQASSGAGGLKFSGVWTVVIVGQIALTVVAPVTVLMIWREASKLTQYDLKFNEQEYLSAEVHIEEQDEFGAPLDSSFSAFQTRYGNALVELDRRMSADPAFAGVTFATRLPGMYHPEQRIELQNESPAQQDSLLEFYVKHVSADADYFDVLGARVVSGRGLHATDAARSSNVVIVNQSFVNDVLRGHNPIGRRLRPAPSTADPAAPPAPWYEIVGVVTDVGTYHEGSQAALYYPLRMTTYPVHALARVRGEPAALPPRMRTIANAVDPTLRLHELASMSEAEAGVERLLAMMVKIPLAMSAVSLLLSLAGIYAIMAFAVSRRTREIGVRVALGARPAQVTLAVFRRPLIQLAIGISVGAYLVTAIIRRFAGELSAGEIASLVAYTAVMTGICLMACIVPTRRALSVEPTEALRAE
jgi:putative ABC transport system permease protein